MAIVSKRALGIAELRRQAMRRLDDGLSLADVLDWLRTQKPEPYVYNSIAAALAAREV